MRVYYEVRFKASEDLWLVRRRDISGGVLSVHEKKAEAVSRGAMEARLHWVNNREPAELVVYREDGAIGKGRGSRRSYGTDPRRSKG